jgi:hypothetical protein
MTPTCQKVTCQPDISGTPADSFFCHVADMSANMSATCQPNKHMSVVLTPILTHRHPKIPAKPECPGELRDGWMLHCHFWDLHPFDSDRVVVPSEGYFPRCKRCWMQVNPAYPGHIRTKECGVGMDRRLQRESGWLSPQPLPCGVSSPSMDHCWNALRFSNTLVACWCRMTMMCRPSGSRCGRLGEFGPR